MSEGGVGVGVGSHVVEGYEEGEECASLEPFFFDDAVAVAVAEHAAAEERRRQKEHKEAREKERHKQRTDAHKAALDQILEYDPKLGCEYFTRFYLADLSTFDLHEESPLGPMRYTETYTERSTSENGTICNQGGKWFHPANSANLLSLKIVSSDVGFPINVYGTVITRDSLDYKCVHLFNRDRDNCQLINSVDEQLILTGPKRGLALIDAIYVEMDLKIKGDRGQKDKEFSKGFLKLDGIQHRFWDKMVVETDTLDTKLSTVEMMYAVVQRAVEATISIEVLQGQFYGTITACTTSIQNSLVLYDSELAGVLTSDGNGIIQLLRPVVAVCVEEMLQVTIVQGKTERTIVLTPDMKGGDQAEFTWCGSLKMLMKVTWSIIAHQHLSYAST